MKISPPYSILLAGLALAVPPCALSAQTAAPTPVADSLVASSTRQHSILVDGAEIPYRATWAETVLKDEAGVPQATISATSYVRSDVGDSTKRPVLFLFNGGPGASSSPLHFTALGPRVRGEGDSMADNPDSLIDVADLVFIDPVGTGFSRELRIDGGKGYWSIKGDPAASLSLIREWLRENGRTQSPLFVGGESYGGLRLALMADDMADLNVAGLVLISPALDMSGTASVPGNDQPFVFSLPSMAVTAWVHGRTDAPQGRTAAQVWEEARAFAQGDYVVALQQGAALPAPERDRIAARMSELIGLPAAAIASTNLRVSTQDFLEQLMPGKIVGRVDTRVAAPVPEKLLNADRPAAANDPALGLGKTNVIRSQSAANYFRDELGVETSRDYFSLSLDVNFNWDWSDARGSRGRPAFYLNPTPNLAELMEEKPGARLLLVSGYYDLATPALAQRYALTHGGLPLDRVDMVALPASHSPFDDPESRKRFSKVVQDLIERQTSGPVTR